MLSSAKIAMEVKGIGSTEIQIRTQIIGTSGSYGENPFLLPAPTVPNFIFLKNEISQT